MVQQVGRRHHHITASWYDMAALRVYVISPRLTGLVSSSPRCREDRSPWFLTLLPLSRFVGCFGIWSRLVLSLSRLS